MAAAKQVLIFISVVYFIQILFSIASAIQIVGQSPINPSINLLNAEEFSGLEENEDLSKTVYQLYKRSVSDPPIKKATSVSEKKTPVKSLSSTESHIQLKTLALDAKSKTENSTLPLNSTEVELSTVGTSLTTDEKYNVSTTKPVAEKDNTTSSSTITTPSTTTVSSTSTQTSTLSDVLPTRPSNISNTTIDHHVYYNSTLFLEDEKAMSFWVNFDELPQDKVVIHQMLSDSHRKAATVSLTFDFPFYGHPLRNITIATGGFVYMGDYMHSWLAATQYIAPLMANFDTSLSNDSTVRYFDNGTAFVIEWNAVTLQDGNRGGNFTFQTTLLNNGNIIFVYKIIPVSVIEIGDEAHPVKVGLSDAYVIDRIIYFIRRKTIYEYHRIDMKREEIGNNTAIYFTALTTCMSFRDCKSCMDADVGLHCVWCATAKRCSDGLDRMRQDWLQSKCDVEKQSVNCSALPSSSVPPFTQPFRDSTYIPYTLFPRTSKYNIGTSTYSPMPYKPGQANDDGASTSARVAEDSSSMGVGSVVAVLLLLAVVLGGLVWVGYAYKNPHSGAGQFLIRYRPSQWRLRSGEARYTPASVHM